jgi:hypothetical protein
MASKLTKADIEFIIADCEAAIIELSKKRSHCHNVMMLELLDLKTKAEIKIVGIEKPFYRFKIKRIYYEVLCYVRNELNIQFMLHSTPITVLLELNNFE